MKAWRCLAAAALAGGFLCSGAAHAVPIDYEGQLFPGATEFGQVGPEPDPDNPSNGDWWYFEAVAGQTYVLTGQRLEATLDPTFDLYFGFGDTDDLEFLGYGDDEIDPLPGLDGPFADPQVIFTADFTGLYSVNLWSYVSDDPGDDNVFDYQISLAVIDAVPEPASFGLLGAGLLGLGALRRFRR